MDDETRAAFGRMDNYFGLIQHSLEQMNIRLTAIEDRVGSLEQRVGGLEQRIGSLEQRIGSLEQRIGSLEDRAGTQEQALASLRLEMRERFISTDEQLRTLALRMQHFEARVEDSLTGISRELTSVHEEVARLGVRMKNVEVGIGDLNTRVDTLADDMRQRFRTIHDRLAAA